MPPSHEMMGESRMTERWLPLPAGRRAALLPTARRSHWMEI